MDTVRGTKNQITVEESKQVRFICQGICLDDKLTNLSLGKGELLQVHLRRRLPAKTNRQHTGKPVIHSKQRQSGNSRS